MNVDNCGALLVAPLICIAGCDPDFQFAGSVTDTSGHPVAGAIVRIDCPSMYAEVATDATGHFRHGGIGVAKDACPVEVHAAGYAVWNEPVTGHCTRYYRPRLCQHIDASVVLTPLPPK